MTSQWRSDAVFLNAADRELPPTNRTQPSTAAGTLMRTDQSSLRTALNSLKIFYDIQKLFKHYLIAPLAGPNRKSAFFFLGSNNHRERDWTILRRQPYRPRMTIKASIAISPNEAMKISERSSPRTVQAPGTPRQRDRARSSVARRYRLTSGNHSR